MSESTVSWQRNDADFVVLGADRPQVVGAYNGPNGPAIRGHTSSTRLGLERSADAVELLTTVPAAAFCSGELRSIEYLAKPSVVRGGMTIVYGAPKVGKTTFVAHMVHGLLDPVAHPFLDGTQPLGGSVLWLDLDQPHRVSQRRLREAGASRDLHVYRGALPSIERLLATIDAREFRGLVVDNGSSERGGLLQMDANQLEEGDMRSPNSYGVVRFLLSHPSHWFLAW